MSTVAAPEITREDLNPCTVMLTVKCTKEQVEEGFRTAIKNFAKGMKVPGFRPGTAPKSVIEKMVPREDLNNEAAEEIIRRVLNKVLKEHEIKPHDSPNVNVTMLEHETYKCEFTAKIPLAPVVELGDYKGLHAQRPTVEVTDAEVDAQIEELRKRVGKKEPVLDRGAVEGDYAVIGIKPAGDSGEGRSFMTIVGKNFKGLDEALVGMIGEEMKNLTLDFPATFQEKDWAGKKMEVQLSLRSINSLQMPDLGNEFARELEGDLKSEDLTGLKKKILERIGYAKNNIAQDYVNETLQAELLKKSKVEVPDNMWEAVANQRLRELDAESRQQGKTIEDYAKANGMTLESMIKAWGEEAKIQVQRAVMAREIFAKEKLVLANEDLNQMLWQMAYEYQVRPEELVAAMKKAGNFQELEIRAVFKKVIDFLNQHAKITSMDGEAAPTTAKAGKKTGESKESEVSEDKPKKTSKKKAD